MSRPGPAVIAGFIISALGGTRVAIGGPTGAFIVILYGKVAVDSKARAEVGILICGRLRICVDK